MAIHWSNEAQIARNELNRQDYIYQHRFYGSTYFTHKDFLNMSEDERQRLQRFNPTLYDRLKNSQK